MKKIANADKEYILYTDGSSEPMTEQLRRDVILHCKQERVFYSRYIIELEDTAETVDTLEEAKLLNDLIRRADSEFTRMSNIIDKLK